MSKRKFSDNELITRSYEATFEIRKDETGSNLFGTPIVFNQPTRIRDWAGEFMEQIEPTAMNEADMSDIRLFVNHDINKIALARSKNGGKNSTMGFSIDESGVHMKAKLDVDNNAEARALYSAVERGDMDGMSFMFRIKDEEWRDIESDLPTRIIKSISIVHEVSVVNFPAYPQTSVSARDSQEGEYSPLEEARKAHAKEIARTQGEALEVERLKNINLFKII